MTTKTWNGGNADWYANSGGDWSPPGDPGRGDAVVVASGSVKLSSGDAAINVGSLTGTGGNFDIQDPGTIQSVTGNVALSGSGTVDLDGDNTDAGGGSNLTIGGNLTNTSTNSYGVFIGDIDDGITSADTVTVKGAGGLSNGVGSRITIAGGAGVQATLNVANAAAGFGAAGVETGTVILQGDALLEFKSGQITTVDGELWLDTSPFGVAGLKGNARVADAGSTSTNSALTGLASVSGEFWLENGSSVATTGNLSVTGAGALDLDGFNTGGLGYGGSNLTIGGNLTNSSASRYGVSVGRPSMPTADTLTVKGAGGLSNTGNITLEGSASGTGNLVVTNDVTSSGAIVVGPYGKLTAAAVDITRGSLQGDGTVVGALNITGGTVVGGLNGDPGALSVSGAYSQSGAGVLQTNVVPGVSPPQSSVVAVSGGPATPGSSGSVNLAGGTLLIDGELSLPLDTTYTVMTFGADHFYGQFADVETEGALGSHTGNGDSVNLGDGDTLEVFYNEASGQVQFEAVATSSATAYDWRVGGGTWNASSAADWSPPGDGTTPSQTSNVVIGAEGGGTVTLAQDETIASLSITSGYMLSGAAESVTATGNVSLASRGALSLDDMNVGGAFTDSGSAALAGVLTINAGGQFILSDGSLTGGGINGSGVFMTSPGATGALKNVTIYRGTTFTASNNATTNISGAIVDEGAIQVNGGRTGGRLNLAGATTLSGGGVVNMTSATGGGGAVLEGNGETLINNDVIQGTGTIGDGNLALTNTGTVDADVSAGALTLNGAGAIANAGVFEATNGGRLDVAGALSGAGRLEIGARSELELGGAASENATFLSASAAKLSIDNATTTTYGGLLASFAQGDVLELGNTNAISATPTLKGSDTTLTVELSGGGALHYTLAGNLTGDIFGVTHVGADSDIALSGADAAFAQAYSLLTAPLTSSFVESNNDFGAKGGAQAGGPLDLAAVHKPHA
ncbi:hypothetical protein DFR50_10241 [Roseiarcus fermentans]|uniref:Uncharacterized protein n=1 Tax=Roseiarcus fermentans TaxID=1473586 RepID=A0A366FU27_9HYPH|nr:hypothetical protein [Roseiarcus fermentans]RBP17550.1 hypothetical protein DFR50_10241 [Roseiarcus fermentans]